MKIFLSWSGSRSREVALALRNWIPLIIHYADPWLSDKDIDAGERWSAEVGKELEASNFGVICLTRENLVAEWILFEAGALSKALQTSAVCPYLLDVEFRDITGPLSQFQAKKAERSQTLELLEAINGKAQSPVDLQRLRELFDALWPKLEERLSAIPVAESSKPAERSNTTVLEELVHVVRGFDSRLSNVEQTILRELRRKTSPRVLPKSSEKITLRISTAIDTPKMKAGEVQIGESPKADAINLVAFATGLNLNSLGSDWALRDKETDRWLTDPYDSKFFDKPHLDLIVEDIPF